MSLPLREHVLTAAEEYPSGDLGASMPTSRAPEVDREFAQILALIAVAEREQREARTLWFQVVIGLGLLGIIVTLQLGFGAVVQGFEWNSFWVREVALLGGLALLSTFVFLSKLIRRGKQHRQVVAELGETIREVISSADWQQKLDPLEWAHLRTRVAQLELVDLSSLR